MLKARRIVGLASILLLILLIGGLGGQQSAAAQEPAIPEAAREAVRLGEEALTSPATMYGSVDHYKRAVELSPTFEAAHMGLAEAYFKLKTFAEAQAPLERVIALNPENGRAHYLLGILHKNSGEEDRKEGAVEAFQNAIRIDPKDHESHFELAFALMRKDRDFEAAEVHARAAHDLNPTVTKTHVLLYTVAAARALEFELIEEELLHILELSPEGPLAARSRVLLEEIHGRLRAQGRTPREVPKD